MSFIDKLDILHYNLLKREFPKITSVEEDAIPEKIERFSSHLDKQTR